MQRRHPPIEPSGIPLPRGQAQTARPRSVDELTDQNVCAIAELERAARLSGTVCDRAACRIASFCGSMSFVWLHVAGFGLWILLNSTPLMRVHPDPFPFTFLTLVVSLEAIFLSAFILISQNQETRSTERRAHLDLQINLLAEQENTKMLSMLQKIAAKVGVDVEGDADLAVLEEAMRPDHLVRQIRRAAEVEQQVKARHETAHETAHQGAHEHPRQAAFEAGRAQR